MIEPTQLEPSRPVINDQLPAFEALAALAEAFPQLPRPYVVVASVGDRVDVQLNSPEAFEEWRAALGVAPASVTLHSYGGSVWLATAVVFGGVPTELRGHGVPLTPAQAAEDALRTLHNRLPLDDADRHDLDDPVTAGAWARLAAEHPEACTPAVGAA